MKKIFNTIIVLMTVSSCSLSDWYGSYDPDPYMEIDENVTRECIDRSIVSLGYVQMACADKDIVPVDGASYVITDESGYKIGPFVCSISGKDTVWHYSYYGVQCISKETGEWKVSRHDETDGYGFRYDFVMNVREGVAEEDEDFAPLNVSFEGTRYENSAYYVTFRTDGELVIWRQESDSYSSFSKRGTIKYLFFDREKQRDWMTSTFLENGSIRYESSF